MPIAVIIDAITNSIVDVKSNKSFDTDVIPLSRREAMTIHKKDGWDFNWKSESRNGNRQVYQLVISGAKRIACKLSFDLGLKDIYLFNPKRSLFEHYKETLGAERISKSRMQIPTESAKKLVNSYYKNYKL